MTNALQITPPRKKRRPICKFSISTSRSTCINLLKRSINRRSVPSSEILIAFFNAIRPTSMTSSKNRNLLLFDLDWKIDRFLSFSSSFLSFSSFLSLSLSLSLLSFSLSSFFLSLSSFFLSLFFLSLFFFRTLSRAPLHIGRATKRRNRRMPGIAPSRKERFSYQRFHLVFVFQQHAPSMIRAKPPFHLRDPLDRPPIHCKPPQLWKTFL